MWRRKMQESRNEYAARKYWEEGGGIEKIKNDSVDHLAVGIFDFPTARTAGKK